MKATCFSSWKMPEPRGYDPFADDDSADLLPGTTEVLVPPPASSAGPPPDREALGRAFMALRRNIDDRDAHAAFVHDCIRAQEVEFAVRCYRDLRARHPDHPQVQAQLDRLGTVLGFMVMPKANPSEGPTLTRRLRLTLGIAVVAALLLVGAVLVAG